MPFLPLPQSATIAGADAPIVETAFLYGKNLGLAFQFVDDLLDFVSSSETMGKPAAADLKLGLATAPVLFACEKVSIQLMGAVYDPKTQHFRACKEVNKCDRVVHKTIDDYVCACCYADDEN
jgi:geranylgeranyl pyrophosphate synthase